MAALPIDGSDSSTTVYVTTCTCTPGCHCPHSYPHKCDTTTTCTGTIIPLPQGPTNKELIDFGYLVIGMSDSMFGRTDEEYASGMVLLRAMMLEYPFDRLCYDHSSARPAERSGISPEWTTAVGSALGERIAATIPGKSLLPQFAATKARAFSALCAAVNCPPPQKYARGTPSGAGNKWPWSDTFMRDGC